MFLMWLLTGLLASATPKVALLPCEPHVEATAADASRLDAKLMAELGSRVDLVPRQRVLKAMAEQGVTGSRSCNDACLVKLGKALGARRVISQSLSIQPKVQVAGIVAIWAVHQVDVDTGRPFGHFERANVRSAPVWWDIIARQFAERLVQYDPSKRLHLQNPEQAKPTKGPVDMPGMVYVPGGEFIMGSEWGEFDEEPRHIVYLDAFYIDTYEVTNDAYARCVAAHKCEPQRVWAKSFLEPNKPAVAMGWENAVAYCRFVGKRLPTEAEWEKAARGTDERHFPWGNTWHMEWVNMHHQKDGFATTAPVGSFPQNVSPYGAYDMAGNAWEWTQDYHSEDYYKDSPRKNPTGPTTGVRRVMRGGSWNYDVPFFVSSHNRSDGRPWIRKKYVGFRCAIDTP
jgi:formylglycine-generating enzyme required for sulfatase activity